MFRTLTQVSALALMATDAATASGKATESKADAKAKTVADDMPSRRVFASVESALPYLGKLSEELSDFGSIPLAFAGGDAEGNFDPAIYTPNMRVMVAKLSKAKEGAKAVVIAPVPTLESLLATDAGKAWAINILDKEFNHVAVRALREAEDISTVVDQMPTTLEAYISSAREGGAGIMESFNELYKALNATLAAKVPVWAKARFTKQELKKSFESKGYADEYYPSVENRGEGKDSLFVTALQLAVKTATSKGLDPTIFQRWLETRNGKTLAAVADEDDFDVDSLTESMLAEEAKEDEKTEA